MFFISRFSSETSGSIRVRRETGNSTSSTNSSLPAIDMSTATLACMTWDSDINVWKSDACDVSCFPVCVYFQIFDVFDKCIWRYSLLSVHVVWTEET